MQKDLDEWLDLSVWFIRVVNYVLIAYISNEQVK